MKDRVKRLMIAAGACVGFATAGTLLTGDALEVWYPSLNQPSYALPLTGWLVVGVLYYFIVGAVLFRVLALPRGSSRTRLLLATAAVMASNEAWNILLFGLRSPRAAFFGLIPFCALVLGLCLALRRADRIAARLLLPYLAWLAYDLVWTRALWRLNPQ